jgi:hypothetical protein
LVEKYRSPQTLNKAKSIRPKLGVLEWFKSYWTGRTQQVKIGSVVSEPGIGLIKKLNLLEKILCEISSIKIGSDNLTVT